jgi:hypothetical protein
VMCSLKKWVIAQRPTVEHVSGISAIEHGAQALPLGFLLRSSIHQQVSR